MTPERKRLTTPEYHALIKLTGVYSVAAEVVWKLRERIELGGAYAEAQAAVDGLYKAMAAVFRTVPADKLASIRKDLDNVYTITKITHGGQQEEESWQYVNAHALDHVVNTAMKYECYGCEKTGAELRKCPFRKRVNELYPCDIAVQVGGECSLCGSTGYRAIEDVCLGKAEEDEV